MKPAKPKPSLQVYSLAQQAQQAAAKHAALPSKANHATAQQAAAKHAALPSTASHARARQVQSAAVPRAMVQSSGQSAAHPPAAGSKGKALMVTALHKLHSTSGIRPQVKLSLITLMHCTAHIAAAAAACWWLCCQITITNSFVHKPPAWPHS